MKNEKEIIEDIKMWLIDKESVSQEKRDDNKTKAWLAIGIRANDAAAALATAATSAALNDHENAEKYVKIYDDIMNKNLAEAEKKIARSKLSAQDKYKQKQAALFRKRVVFYATQTEHLELKACLFKIRDG
jgi:hypothetical protein